jgi:hypothetical protein
MKEFIVFNDNMINCGEEESCVQACKAAYKLKGFVGVKNINTGKIKEVIQGKTLEHLANK